MTCVAAWLDRNDFSITMGADSAACNENGEKYDQLEPKVFRNNGFIVGLSGAPRILQILRYKFDFPRPDKNVRQFMITKFVNDLKNV